MKLSFFLLLLGVSSIGLSILPKTSSISTHSDETRMLLGEQQVFNVLHFGAVAKSKTDNSKAFLAAWAAACSSAQPSVLYVPNGNFWLDPVSFEGPCKNDNIMVQINGELIAPRSNRAWSNSDVNYWLQFMNINGLTIEGGGQLHGHGESWWNYMCKNLRCPPGPTSLRLSGNSNLVVRNITSINSRQAHITINDCNNVRVEGVKIKAPVDSINTDGIHLQSSNVLIRDTVVRTGDDCVSIGGGSSNIVIEGFTCGPGHGISVGSLGKGSVFEVVSNITVNGAVFNGTQNGVRIKTWEGGKGIATDLTFQNIKMKNTNNPIIIDQYYCPHGSCFTKGFGGTDVKISNVVFKNIIGTSSSKMAISLACSKRVPCQGIKVENVKLSFKEQPAQAVCENIKGIAIGFVKPILVCK